MPADNYSIKARNNTPSKPRSEVKILATKIIDYAIPRKTIALNSILGNDVTVTYVEIANTRFATSFSFHSVTTSSTCCSKLFSVCGIASNRCFRSISIPPVASPQLALTVLFEYAFSLSILVSSRHIIFPHLPTDLEGHKTTIL